MSPSVAALEVRLSWRTPDGRVLRRERLCWSHPPPAVQLLRALAARALAARRAGARLDVQDAPPSLRPLLTLAGLDSVLGGAVGGALGGEPVR